jgi:hypothetical protein
MFSATRLARGRDAGPPAANVKSALRPTHTTKNTSANPVSSAGRIRAFFAIIAQALRWICRSSVRSGLGMEIVPWARPFTPSIICKVSTRPSEFLFSIAARHQRPNVLGTIAGKSAFQPGEQKVRRILRLDAQPRLTSTRNSGVQVPCQTGILITD